MDKIWEELYNATRAVRCGRRISEYVEGGGSCRGCAFGFWEDIHRSLR